MDNEFDDPVNFYPYDTRFGCRCCGVDWTDDIRCKTQRGKCTNCCSCAFGVTRPTENGCVLIEKRTDNEPPVQDEDKLF